MWAWPPGAVSAFKGKRDNIDYNVQHRVAYVEWEVRTNTKGVFALTDWGN